jgi:hypothetical protein
MHKQILQYDIEQENTNARSAPHLRKLLTTSHPEIYQKIAAYQAKRQSISRSHHNSIHSDHTMMNSDIPIPFALYHRPSSLSSLLGVGGAAAENSDNRRSVSHNSHSHHLRAATTLTSLLSNSTTTIPHSLSPHRTSMLCDSLDRVILSPDSKSITSHQYLQRQSSSSREAYIDIPTDHAMCPLYR